MSDTKHTTAAGPSTGSTPANQSPEPAGSGPAAVIPPFEMFEVEKFRRKDGWSTRQARRCTSSGVTEYRAANLGRWVAFSADDPRFREPTTVGDILASEAPGAADSGGCDGSSSISEPQSPDRSAPVPPFAPWSVSGIVDQLQTLAAVSDIDEEQLVAELRRRTEPEHADLRGMVHYKINRLRRGRIRQQSSSLRFWMSDIGHACLRYLFYRRTHGHMASKHSTGTQAIFDIGRVFETWARSEFEEAGIVLREAETPVVLEGLDTSGRIDNTIEVGAYGRGARDLVVVDFKSANPNVFSAIRERWDWLTSAPYWWMRKYSWQVIGGAIARADLLGFDPVGSRVSVIFVCKSTGQFKVLEHTITRDDEKALKLHVYEAKRYVDKWQECETDEERESFARPDRIAVDEGWCGRCAFAQTVCFPDPPLTSPLSITRDSRIVEWTRRRMELASAASEFKKLDKKIKDILKDPEKASQDWSELIVDGAGGTTIKKSKRGTITFKAAPAAKEEE